MRHRKSKVTLDRVKGQRELMLRTLAEGVVLHEGLNTTAAKARAVKPLVEKMITRGKVNTVFARRYLMTFFTKEAPVKKILEVLGPKYLARQGGYTRIIKLGQRKGDAAEVVRIELV
ncbi:MAG: 50S ribosomal protein L17 [Candidatus Magasanikbacteria bacterium]|nr:50S ribosomal protein L17 [Candidatus Magasanikbacteria bacterium]